MTGERKEKMDTLIYDVEVLKSPLEVDGGWNNPEAMGFGTAVVWSYFTNQYFFFAPNQKDSLIEILKENKVISFNGIKFDNRVVLGNDYGKGKQLWGNIDLLLEVIQGKYFLPSVAEAEAKLGDKEVHDGSVGLDGLAEGTLGLHKTGHGSHAPQLIKEGRWSEVFAYKLQDVRLTKQLYEFAVRYGYLIDRKGNKIPLLHFKHFEKYRNPNH